MTAMLRVPWVIDLAGRWMRAEDGPATQPLFCSVCGQPVILKRGPHRRWHAVTPAGLHARPMAKPICIGWLGV